MPDPLPIDDPDDPRLTDFARLDDPAFRIRHERTLGFFVVEGPRPIRTALTSPHRGRLRSVLVTPQQHDALADALSAVAAPIYVAPMDLLRRIVGFDLHRGAVASVDRFPMPPLGSVVAGARLVAVCERVNDHENLGAIFRNAAALGVDAVVLDRECSDPLYRRCVRVSIGHVLTVPWTRIEPLPRALADVRAMGFFVIAMTPRADALDISSFSGEPDRAIALLLGAEGSGLSDGAMAAADALVHIPMRDTVDSLNVATAAAIAFHRLGHPGDPDS